MCVPGDCKLQPCSTVFQKASQCKRHANSGRESATASGPPTVAGKSPRKAGQTRHPFGNEPGPVEPELGESRRRHLSPGKSVAQRKLSSPATGEKSRQLSISWRVCVCAQGADQTGRTGRRGHLGNQSESQGKPWHTCAANSLNVAQGTRI